MKQFTPSELYKKQKHTQKKYNLNYTPIIYSDFNDVILYLDKLADKKQPIFKLKRTELYIITHASDKVKMESLGFINLNTIQ